MEERKNVTNCLELLVCLLGQVPFFRMCFEDQEHIWLEEV